jgi:hypothetical protein
MSIKNLFNVSLNGSNFSSTADSYRLKKFYEDTILSDNSFPYKIDTWKADIMYGRVDSNNNSIIVHDGFMKNVPEIQNITNLDFVVDAFSEMRQYYIELSRNGVHDGISGPYGNLTPTSGYSSVYHAYDSHMNIIYQTFYGNNYDFLINKAKDFNEFIDVFIEFLYTVLNQTFFTRSSYCLSKELSILSSGLAFEFSNNYKYDDDFYKINVFIENDHFDIMHDVCKRYGFRIDKNIPWRIVADLTSPAMEKYLFKYALHNIQAVFDKRYFKTYITDIDLLKFYVKQFWNSTIVRQPNITVKKYNCGTIKNDIVERKIITENQLDFKFDDYFFTRLYIFIKALEMKKDWTQQQF